MEFQVGDIVVKPSIGVCRITDIRKVDVDGAPKDFFVFSAGEVSVMVPVSNTIKSGIRQPISSEDAASVWKGLSEPLQFPNGMTDRDAYRLHPKYIKETLRKRDPAELTQLVKLLFNKSRDFHTERKEKEFLEQGISMIAEEVSFVEGRDRLETIKQMKDLLSEAREERRRQQKKDRPA